MSARALCVESEASPAALMAIIPIMAISLKVSLLSTSCECLLNFFLLASAKFNFT